MKDHFSKELHAEKFFIIRHGFKLIIVVIVIIIASLYFIRINNTPVLMLVLRYYWR
jgi:hypothetical protein